MKVEILQDATLTVKAGQIVDIDENNIGAALRLGFVRIPTEEKKPAPKKSKK